MNRSTRLHRGTLVGLVCVAFMALPALADANEAAVKRIKTRLGSPEVWDRISALRDLMRLSPDESVARPLLESVLSRPLREALQGSGSSRSRLCDPRFVSPLGERAHA